MKMNEDLEKSCDGLIGQPTLILVAATLSSRGDHRRLPGTRLPADILGTCTYLTFTF